MDVVQWGAIALLSAGAGLDRTAVLQSLLCRPLVCAPLAGSVVGQWTTGLAIGCLLELVWLLRLPVGATVAPDDTQVAIAGTLLYAGGLISFPLPEEAAVGFVALLCATVAGVGRHVEILVRQFNVRFSRRGLCSQGLAPRCHWCGAVAFVLGAWCSLLFCGLLIWLASFGLQWLLLLFPVPTWQGLPALLLLLAVVGLLPLLRIPHGRWLFFGSFLTTYVVAQVF
ncbi:MAG: PTS sugar transporter subunit IIC [Desulfuromonadaceae bacterium]|nr:PTS sugar transporter subunit IIC [Desulfuromonadaceae bacterium]